MAEEDFIDEREFEYLEIEEKMFVALRSLGRVYQYVWRGRKKYFRVSWTNLGTPLKDDTMRAEIIKIVQKCYHYSVVDNKIAQDWIYFWLNPPNNAKKVVD